MGTEVTEAPFTSYGTRHRSAFRFVEGINPAVAFILSQDGDIKAATLVALRLLLSSFISISDLVGSAFRTPGKKHSWGLTRVLQLVRFYYYPKGAPSMVMTVATAREQIQAAVLSLLPEHERGKAIVTDNTHLIKDLGLASEDGGDLHADLCRRFGIEIPPEVNPLVFPNGKRGRRFRDVVALVIKTAGIHVEKTA